MATMCGYYLTTTKGQRDLIREIDCWAKVGVFGAALVSYYAGGSTRFNQLINKAAFARLGLLSLNLVPDVQDIADGTWLPGNDRAGRLASASCFITGVTTALLFANAMGAVKLRSWGPGVEGLLFGSWVTGATLGLLSAGLDDSAFGKKKLSAFAGWVYAVTCLSCCQFLGKAPRCLPNAWAGLAAGAFGLIAIYDC